MPVPQTVLTLIENFERNLDAYRDGKYNETQVRRDFIDPFFKALGWDMDNSLGYAEAYRDVIHEDTIKVGISTRAPDYSFRIGGARKFFLEAKKPSVNVKDDVEPAFQLRRYAWSAKLPLSIVTDFEEFAVYDCRQKPDKNDKASKSRLFYCTFRDYAEKWDEIAAIFSKDAVLKGSFDKYASTSKGKRGTTEVDNAFLEEIENWRNLLAHNIALRNDNLSQRDLNFAVQQTIDRIIFLRICEDRGIEPYGKLMALQNGVNVYARLREMFHDADDRYNSGLFHFKREKGRAVAPDELTLHLEIDDKPLKEIFKNLYYPDCPYEFSVLGADILGSVYEQFLGKVIRLTSGNRAVVEDKPEVKKAGGVFYTPSYIVKYIVEHTVGKLLEGKSAKQAEGIRILDPACGSGSFLIGAYQHLLDWYLAHYVEEGAEKNSKGKAARIRPSAHGAWRLTTAEKKRILLEHIYGVDIDAQAVEVTKLSLLLKMLEGESDESLISQMKLFHERVLPDLERNIQCGNSLIGPDFYDGQLDLDDEAVQRINVFDWQAAFPQVFKIPPNPPLSKGGNPQPPLQDGVERSGGGFDAVIGNPPYVVLTAGTIPANSLDYLNSYEVAQYKTDLFHLFIEKGIQLLKKNALLGYITPTTWFTLQFTTKLRQYVLSHSSIDELVIFGHHVFSGADVNTGLIFLSKKRFDKNHNIAVKSFPEKFLVNDLFSQKSNFSKQQQWADDNEFKFEYRQTGKSGELTKRISAFPTLESQARASIGCQAYNSSKHTQEQITNRVFHSDKKISDEYLPELAGSDVGRYTLNRKKGQWIKYGSWLHDYRPMDWLMGPRIIVREIAGKPPHQICAAYTEETYCNYKTTLVIAPSVNTEFSMKYLTGILNSRLLSFLYPLVSSKIVTGTFPRLTVRDIKKLPIPKYQSSNSHEVYNHDKLVALVEKMLALHQQLATAKTPQDTTLLQRQIDVTDRQIDQLVYALYGLSEEEIALVEGA
jgi:type I restriction-modification system DNA methylase subunit